MLAAPIALAIARLVDLRGIAKQYIIMPIQSEAIL